MFSIGRFSIITQISIKSLRRYHELEILVPDYIDDESGYRYYRESSVDRARVIISLRSIGFSNNEIKSIIENYSDDEDIILFLEKRKKSIYEKIEQYKNIQTNIDNIIVNARRNKMNEEKQDFNIIEKNIDDIIFAGYRMKGIYSQIGKAFGKVAKKAGRYIADKPIGLYYDGEYKEKDADFEGGFPLKKSIDSNEINCRILKGGKAVTIIHKGAYENLGNSYSKIFKYIEDKNFKVESPTREIYIKGPGMIFKGNPEKYLTEIQFLIM